MRQKCKFFGQVLYFNTVIKSLSCSHYMHITFIFLTASVLHCMPYLIPSRDLKQGLPLCLLPSTLTRTLLYSAAAHSYASQVWVTSNPLDPLDLSYVPSNYSYSQIHAANRMFTFNWERGTDCWTSVCEQLSHAVGSALLRADMNLISSVFYHSI